MAFGLSFAGGFAKREMERNDKKEEARLKEEAAVLASGRALENATTAERVRQGLAYEYGRKQREENQARTLADWNKKYGFPASTTSPTKSVEELYYYINGGTGPMVPPVSGGTEPIIPPVVPPVNGGTGPMVPPVNGGTGPMVPPVIQTSSVKKKVEKDADPYAAFNLSRLGPRPNLNPGPNDSPVLLATGLLDKAGERSAQALRLATVTKWETEEDNLKISRNLLEQSGVAMENWSDYLDESQKIHEPGKDSLFLNEMIEDYGPQIKGDTLRRLGQNQTRSEIQKVYEASYVPLDTGMRPGSTEIVNRVGTQNFYVNPSQQRFQDLKAEDINKALNEDLKLYSADLQSMFDPEKIKLGLLEGGEKSYTQGTQIVENLYRAIVKGMGGSNTGSRPVNASDAVSQAKTNVVGAVMDGLMFNVKNGRPSEQMYGSVQIIEDKISKLEPPEKDTDSNEKPDTARTALDQELSEAKKHVNAITATGLFAATSNNGWEEWQRAVKRMGWPDSEIDVVREQAVKKLVAVTDWRQDIETREDAIKRGQEYLATFNDNRPFQDSILEYINEKYNTDGSEKGGDVSDLTNEQMGNIIMNVTGLSIEDFQAAMMEGKVSEADQQKLNDELAEATRKDVIVGK